MSDVDSCHSPSRAVPGAAVLVTTGALLLFATGIGSRPDGSPWGLLYDIVLYNVVFAGACAACVQVARRRPAEALAWWALAVANACTLAGNLTYSLVVAELPEEPFPSVSDWLYLAAYPALYVGLIALIRARVPRFHSSMWLDGVVGALGATAVAVGVLLGPALSLGEGDTAAVVVNLAYPLADVLLLALMVAICAMLGLRGGTGLLLLGAGVLANLVGDVVYLSLSVRGIYVEGGPLDLTWLIGAALTALAADRSRTSAGAGSVPVARRRVGWRILAVPVACNLASVALLAAGWGDSYPDVGMWAAAGCILAGMVRTGMTVTELRAYHEVLTQARTDDLTGLPNRRDLLDRASQVLAAADTARPAALLLLDLDGFKQVNDDLGHAAGDELLRQVAPRLLAATGPSGLVARLGGDEFAVLLTDTPLDGALATARAILDLLAAPFPVQGVGVGVCVGVSIGVATAPVPAAEVGELLRCADIAMYQAKSTGEGVRVYLPGSPARDDGGLRLVDDPRDAVADGRLAVHLRPQVALGSGRVRGVEALVRWEHPTRGLLTGADLLPAAVLAGMARQLGASVLDLALAAASHWWPSRQIPVSVRLSGDDLADPALTDDVAAALERRGLPPAALTLELAEDVLAVDPERSASVLQRLHRTGIGTSIGDYGSGSGTPSALRRLHTGQVLLDRWLTADVVRDPRARTIVQHMVSMAHALGLEVVVDGVEDEATAEALRDLGCDSGLGPLFGRPVPVERIDEYLDSRQAALPALR